jgi:hypothetical protein
MPTTCLDQRQKVTDQRRHAHRYQPYVLDPQGRVLGMELRKMF